MLKNKNPILLIFAISALILSVTAFFYFAIHLPKIEFEKLESAKEQERTKLILEQQFKEELKNQYDTCMAQAEQEYRESWLRRCEANNVPIYLRSNGTRSCTLLDTVSEPIRERYETEKDRCIKVLEQF